MFTRSSFTCSLDLLSSYSLNLAIKAKSFQGDAIAFTMQDSNAFKISAVPDRPNEAVIRATASLDYESDARVYGLILTATERDTRLSSTALVQFNYLGVRHSCTIELDLTCAHPQPYLQLYMLLG